MKEFYIISTKHTATQDNLFTFWRPNSSGYCQIVERAGIYTENKTNLKEGILYVEKSIIDKLLKKVSGVWNDFDMESFSILPNIGEVRKELGITYFNLNENKPKNDYFGLFYPDKIYEVTKEVIDNTKFHVKAKESVDEFWFMDEVFEAENRNKAILKAFEEWIPAEYDTYIEFKADMTCRRVKENVFEKWSA